MAFRVVSFGRVECGRVTRIVVGMMMWAFLRLEWLEHYPVNS